MSFPLDLGKSARDSDVLHQVLMKKIAKLSAAVLFAFCSLRSTNDQRESMSAFQNSDSASKSLEYCIEKKSTLEAKNNQLR